MCVIVDNNVAARALVHDDVDFLPVKRAVLQRRHKLVHGGKLTDELTKNTLLRRVLMTFDRTGLSRIVPRNSLEPLERQLVDDGACESNDQHIVALAIVSGARVLCTEDRPLKRDFKNRALIARPAGRIFQNATHHQLVARRCRCPACR